MALFPCDIHGARYSGKQSTVYLAVGSEGEMDRVRLRTCEPCLREITEDALSVLGIVVENGEPVGDLQSSFECSRCDAQTETVPIFLTVYPVGRGQDQWYGRMCPSCAADWRTKLLAGSLAAEGSKPPTPPKSR